VTRPAKWQRGDSSHLILVDAVLPLLSQHQ
jgi:hypothetical protein